MPPLCRAGLRLLLSGLLSEVSAALHLSDLPGPEVSPGGGLGFVGSGDRGSAYDGPPRPSGMSALFERRPRKAIERDSRQSLVGVVAVESELGQPAVAGWLGPLPFFRRIIIWQLVAATRDLAQFLL